MILKEKHLNEIWNSYGLGSDDLLQHIISKYQEKNRHYHDLHHISHLFLEFEKMKHLLNSPINILAAIFCHDVVFDPYNNDNEEKSAEYVNYFDNRINKHKVYYYILATKNHDHIVYDNDECYFLDLDLTPLAVNYDVFQENLIKIRSEFYFIDDDTFYENQKRFLTNLINKDSIYKTEYFYNLYEQKARDNISSLL